MLRTAADSTSASTAGRTRCRSSSTTEETIRVNPPETAEQRFEWQRATVQPGDEPPPAIHSFIEREGEVDEAGGRQVGPLAVGSRRRYSEGLLEPGENVYMLGRARETDAGWDDRD